MHSTPPVLRACANEYTPPLQRCSYFLYHKLYNYVTKIMHPINEDVVDNLVHSYKLCNLLLIATATITCSNVTII